MSISLLFPAQAKGVITRMFHNGNFEKYTMTPSSSMSPVTLQKCALGIVLQDENKEVAAAALRATFFSSPKASGTTSELHPSKPREDHDGNTSDSEESYSSQNNVLPKIVHAPPLNSMMVDHTYTDYSVVKESSLAFLEEGEEPNSKMGEEERKKYTRRIAKVKKIFGEVVPSSINSGGVVKPFPEMLMEVLDHPDMEAIMSWMPHGRAFVILQPQQLDNVLPRFCKHTKSTFTSQLNLYGFKRITKGDDTDMYYHELFLRGRPRLAMLMRCKIVKGTGIKLTPSRENEPNFYKISEKCPALLAVDPSTKYKHWTAEEHRLFLQGLEIYGNRWSKVAKVVKSRTRHQIFSYGQRYFKKLARQKSAEQGKYENKNKQWTKEEHRLFLQGLEIYGEHWDKVASVVKSRTREQTYSHALNHFRTFDCQMDQGKYGTRNKRWTKEEHRLFLQGLENYGEDWEKVAIVVKSRTTEQTYSHFKNHMAAKRKRKQGSSSITEREKDTSSGSGSGSGSGSSVEEETTFAAAEEETVEEPCISNIEAESKRRRTNHSQESESQDDSSKESIHQLNSVVANRIFLGSYCTGKEKGNSGGSSSCVEEETTSEASAHKSTIELDNDSVSIQKKHVLDVSLAIENQVVNQMELSLPKKNKEPLQNFLPTEHLRLAICKVNTPHQRSKVADDIDDYSDEDTWRVKKKAASLQEKRERQKNELEMMQRQEREQYGTDHDNGDIIYTDDFDNKDSCVKNQLTSSKKGQRKRARLQAALANTKQDDSFLEDDESLIHHGDTSQKRKQPQLQQQNELEQKKLLQSFREKAMKLTQSIGVDSATKALTSALTTPSKHYKKSHHFLDDGTPSMTELPPKSKYNLTRKSICSSARKKVVDEVFELSSDEGSENNMPTPQHTTRDNEAAIAATLNQELNQSSRKKEETIEETYISDSESESKRRKTNHNHDSESQDDSSKESIHQMNLVVTNQIIPDLCNIWNNGNEFTRMRKIPNRGHAHRQMYQIGQDYSNSFHRFYEALLIKKDYEINDALSARKQMQAQVEEMEKQIQAKSEENFSLQKETIKMRQTISSLNTKLDKTIISKQNQFYDLIKQNCELERKLKTKEEQCLLLEEKQEAHKREYSRMKEHILSQVSKIEKISEMKRQQFYNLTAKNGELYSRLQAKSEQCKLLEDKNSQCLHREEEYAALVDEKHKLSRMLQLKEDEFSQVDSEHEEKIREMEQAKESYKQESQHLKQTLLQRQKQYESMSKLQKELKSELECSICIDLFENPYMIPECCHRFCKHCIEESLARSGKQCPLCRCNVSSKRVLRKDELIGRISEVLIFNEQSEGVE